MRDDAGLTQRELAERLELDHTQIAKSERGTRRVDPVEFAYWARACEADPVEAMRELVAKLR